MQVAGLPEGAGAARLPFVEPADGLVATVKAMMKEWCQETDAALVPSWCARL